MKQQPTFVFENGKAYAVVGKRVVASADSVEALEQKLADHDPYGVGAPQGPGDLPAFPADDGYGQGQPPQGAYPEGDSCPQCGGTNVAPDRDGTIYCPECGWEDAQQGSENPMFNPEQGVAGQGMENPYPHDEHQGLENPMDPRLGQVITPNGLRGTILGKVKDIWGETVTVRFSNGRIVQLPVTSDLKVVAHKVAADKSTPLDRLEASLATSVDGTRESLTARQTELTQVKRGATDLLRQGASHSELERLDAIVVQADYELQEVSDAIEHIDQAEPFVPSAPFEPRAVEQESVGGNDSSWLDATINEMVAEAESTDYNQLMDEGPEAFIGELETPALADAQSLQGVASKYLRGKTAGADPEIREKYEQVWLARVEEVRVAELEKRKESQLKVTAAEEQIPDVADDALFL